MLKNVGERTPLWGCLCECCFLNLVPLKVAYHVTGNMEMLAIGG